MGLRYIRRSSRSRLNLDSFDSSSTTGGRIYLVFTTTGGRGYFTTTGGRGYLASSMTSDKLSSYCLSSSEITDDETIDFT
jgi:hypothetical protein